MNLYNRLAVSIIMINNNSDFDDNDTDEMWSRFINDAHIIHAYNTRKVLDMVS